jgi:GH25 family lysozyme M1 (1,4-beta-N-acetylmuramidase)
MADTRVADISEHQPNIDGAAFLAGGCSCLIVRAHNGNRKDNIWPARRDYLRGLKFNALGWYQYVVSSRDAAQQARDFCATVGSLRPNEFVVCDSEEGSGSQVARIQAWFDVVDEHYGQPSVLYASESWFRERLGGVGRWSGRPRWIAAYRSTEPTDPHELWQNTDKASFPGVAGGVDGSLFRGTAQDFLRVMRGGTRSPDSKPAPPPRTGVPTLHVDYFDQSHHARHGDVMVWQGQMRTRGWDLGPGGADGAYGPASEKVCRAFQAEKQLGVDGRVGPKTWAVAWTAPIR